MPSIYKRICAEYQKNRKLPYEFMPDGIGASSLTAVRHNEIPLSLRQVCARRSLRSAFEGGEWSIIEPIWFARELLQEIDRRIAEGTLSPEEVSRRGMQLATGSENAHAVEAGLLMMGYRQDDLTAQVMERLALHSKFTLVAIIAAERWPEHNARVFRWLRHTAGCGSVVCALMLRPETDEQRGWLFREGLINAQPRLEMALCIVERPSMLSYILRQPDTAENFHALCRLVCYAPADMEKTLADRLALKLLQGLEHASQYIDLCAVHRLQRVLLDPQGDVYAEFEQRTAHVRGKLRRQGVIERELDDPREGADLLVLALTGERMAPPLERFVHILARQNLPAPLLRFFLLYHGDGYADRLLECMMQVSPKTLFSDPPSIRDCRELPGGEYDRWLAVALSAMSGEPSLDISVPVKCLGARAVAVRAAAVRCLEAMDEPVSREEEPALRRAVSLEPDAELRKRMVRLLDGMNRVALPHVRVPMPDTDPEMLRWCALGEPLRYVEITGRERYNSGGVRELGREGERLLLVRGAEGAVLAATSGGTVIGEVELPETDALQELLDAGETVCAVLEGTLYMEHVWAEIRRPLRDVTLPARGEVRAFPLRKR